jgi:hypothetical protein
MLFDFARLAPDRYGKLSRAAVTPRDGGPEDTGVHIRRSGELVAEVVPRVLAEAMDATSGAHGPEVDEPALVARLHGRGWYARSTDRFEIGRPEQDQGKTP